MTFMIPAQSMPAYYKIGYWLALRFVHQCWQICFKMMLTCVSYRLQLAEVPLLRQSKYDALMGTAVPFVLVCAWLPKWSAATSLVQVTLVVESYSLLLFAFIVDMWLCLFEALRQPGSEVHHCKYQRVGIACSFFKWQ